MPYAIEFYLDGGGINQGGTDSLHASGEWNKNDEGYPCPTCRCAFIEELPLVEFEAELTQISQVYKVKVLGAKRRKVPPQTQIRRVEKQSN